MRCSNCRSYIPEGLSSALTCPQCGKTVETAAPTPVTASQEKTPGQYTSAEELFPSEKPHDPSGFAPYFTIRSVFSFTVENLPASPDEGSISFGPSGFSIVLDEGKRWEKIHYRDLKSAELRGDHVELNIADKQTRIAFHRSWLPGWMARPSKKHAAVFHELLNHVKHGLTPTEVAIYQRRLA